MTYSSSTNARQLRAQLLSDNAMDYWSVIRSTIKAMKNDRMMKTTCQSAAQLLAPNGNPARTLLARLM
jgi:histidine ammonia-lyase